MKDVLILLGIVAGIAALIAGMIAIIRWRFNVGRSLNMVFLLIKTPKKESKDDREKERDQFSSGKSFKEVVGVMKQVYEAMYATYNSKFIDKIIGQDFFSFEYAVQNGLVDFYCIAPRKLADFIEKQITSFYPDSYVERVSDYNIFKENNKATGCYMKLAKESLYPIKVTQNMSADPLNNMTNVMSKMGKDEAAAIQIMLKPAQDGWQKSGRKKAKEIMEDKPAGFWHTINPLTWVGAIINLLFRGPTDEYLGNKPDHQGGRVTPLTDEQIKAIEQKNTQIGYETIIRIVTSSPTIAGAGALKSLLKGAFAQFNTTDNNAFKYTRYHSDKYLINNFIYRHFRRNWTQRLFSEKMILSAEELVGLFHLPDVKYNMTPVINWQNYKIAPPPSNLPKEGILIGHNVYRGVKTEVRIKNEDRFRHFYVIGQTGTGKSSVLQVMIRQDLKLGHGICVIDPHGQLIEDIIPFIPRERADDVIYFNPGDLDRPIGINLLEASSEEEKDYVALEAMNIMIKLFDEEIFGPRIQDYFRNGCLTLMSDPEGGSLTDIVRLFTDDAFQKLKVEHVKNPVVKSFWLHQMAKTGAREKQEMIPYFAAKFGAFVTNGMMRNIIGQAKSAFDFSEAMNSGKILLMNLSKGETGDLNSKLLGMLIVSKIQMAAMRRQKLSKDARRDFFLYIDEFQNYVTDSIESILSEARKYRLGLHIAHQYLAQLEGGSAKKGQKQVSLKDAVFGNVGSIMAYKIGAQDSEFMGKEMAPVFSDQDLVNIDKYKAVMKLSIDTQPSRPFSVIPVNPYTEEGDHEVGDAIKQLSRLKFGRDKEFVEREIFRRLGTVFD
ncbi:hypothetical protein A2344_01775 [Candidatus Peregrinibacteria bacterium RIFOXYB12_FULL_41_12]|nr:MAG: hypothetical protein A2244_02930 [Candidatus Peregrinibacteria bacterium RIFOXYA2_FULL_41_18]OGJ47998.1 MAG: hypothetical protein A2344_01775 [Candidatus Peregrinibacteria bacterium RIFOXYB12_FULL_41_12]OGJ51670.1 MAG: hypothetical protein A2336_01535 [Candidatus Peregrinibacteria bacterium RIFOXYB2_FULL_41_88]OGJ52868.1 MAG: hypothetical protein A2448_00795 [Candidatus Peregrinibacteria bacterium RIFOXYC2_FULL_41_22]